MVVCVDDIVVLVAVDTSGELRVLAFQGECFTLIESITSIVSSNDLKNVLRSI